MEKKLTQRKQTSKNLEYRTEQISNIGQTSISFKPLGGITLYNEQYQRHLANKRSPFPRTSKEAVIINEKQPMDLDFETPREEIQRQFYEQYEINSFMGRQKTKDIQSRHNVIAEIADIISLLNNSHANTSNFIEQLQRQKQETKKEDVQTFDELLKLFKNNNSSNLSSIISKMFKELKNKMFSEYQRLKEDFEAQNKAKREKMETKETQTNNRNYEKDLHLLKKQLKVKELQYNALYEHSKQKRDSFLDSVFLEEKNQNIQWLQESNQTKEQEIKKLQKRVDVIQDKFFKKLIQSQRKTSRLIRSQLQSILEDEFDEFEGKRLKNKAKKNIVKKGMRNFKGNRLSLAESDLNAKGKQFVASAFDIDQRPRSLKQIRSITNDFDSQLSFDVRRISKKSSEKRKLHNLIQKYLSKDKVKKSSVRKNKDSKLMRNQSVRMIGSDKMIKPKNQLLQPKSSFDRQSGETSQKKKKKQSVIISPDQPSRMQTQTSTKTKNATPEIKLSRIESLKQRVSEDESGPKLNSFKSIKVDDLFPKKKKGVSFHIDQMLAKALLKINHKQVDFCYKPIKKRIREVTQPKISMTASRQSQASQPPKQKKKLIKAKPKQKKNHFKAVSCFQQLDKEIKQLPQKEEEKVQPLKHTSRIPKVPSSDEIQRYSVAGSLSQWKASPPRFFERFTHKIERKVTVQDSEITKMAIRCKSKEKFYHQIQAFHKGCGQNCEHIKRYLQIFDKIKSRSIRTTLKMSCQNLNNHISKSTSTYVNSSAMLSNTLIKQEKMF